MTDEAVQVVEQVANEVAPNSIAVQAVEAAVKTAASPTDPITLIEDVKLVASLWSEFKAKIQAHPTLSDIVKALF